MAMDNDQETSRCHLTEPAQIGALLQSLCDRQIPISLRLEDSTLYSASSDCRAAASMFFTLETMSMPPMS